MAIDSILIATDGSPGAWVGARRAIDVANRVGANVHVISVVNVRELSDLSIDDEVLQMLQRQAEDATDEIASSARMHLTGRVTQSVEEGVPVEAISDYADRHGIDLIAMGTRGRTGIQRLLLGSVAEKTIRSANVPVMTATPNADLEIGEAEYENVLLPTDGSGPAERAIEWGVGLADQFGATIHSVYSVDPGRFGVSEGAAALYDVLEETGREALERVRGTAGERGVDVETGLSRGPAGRVILDYAEDHDIDMVIMGTHGRSGVSRYLIGSVTETVVRHAEVPVCSVPMESATND